MAKNKENSAQTEVQPAAAGTEEKHVEQTAEASESKAEAQAPVLETLAELANRHRVPVWQQAALERFMGWTDDKRVSKGEYLAALDLLKARRIGGGRR